MGASGENHMILSRRHFVLSALLILAAAAPALAQTINHSGGFASNGDLTANGNTVFDPGGSGIARVTPGFSSARGSFWSTAQVNVVSFATSFRIRMTPGSFPMADGMTFAIQRAGVNALGGFGTELGYTGIPNSVCVKFDIYPGSNSSTGIYSNGATPQFPEIPLNPTLNFHSGNIFQVNMNYDGFTLNVTITDTTTTASLSQSYPINIPATIGGDTAHVGFTAATGGLSANHDVLDWTYAETTTIASLRAEVAALTVPAQISASNKQLLLNLLDSAQLRVNQGRPATAVTLLRSFITYVNKFQTANLLQGQKGGEFITDANVIIGGLLTN
jgi:hypothetical protein